MIEGSPSRTALGVAKRRALHQVVDHPLVFPDPLAEKIIAGLEGESLAASRSIQVTRGMRAFVAARSRYAEDELTASFYRGTEQYVVLGAGLDTFAYRNPYAPALKVFEVDHPGTQAWKIERLRAAGILIPDSIAFVPVNFETQDLAQALETAPEFDTRRPALFSMLGTTPYLTRSALLMTLRAIVSMPAGSGVVFDYVVPSASLNLPDKIRLRMLSARVEKIGEAFRLFLEPRKLFGMLQQLGFTHIQDLGQQEINSRYFHDRSDGLQIGGAIGRILSASVNRLCEKSGLSRTIAP